MQRYNSKTWYEKTDLIDSDGKQLTSEEITLLDKTIYKW